MTEYILALDQGTTSSRAILFDRNGGIVRSAQEEFRQYYPRPGWVEHDAEEIWASQLEVARAVVDDPAAIAAIGISNQRETTIIWDRKTGEPIHNAIVWQDRRTAALCDALKAEGFDQTILAAHWFGHGRLLLRHQSRLAAERGRRRARKSGSWRAGVRHG